MSRTSRTISLPSTLSSFLPGPGAAPEDEKDETVVKQFLPRKQVAVFGDQFVHQTTSLRQGINARLMLLVPLACDAPPFAKSVIYLSSLSGPIRVTMCRQSDVEDHFFCLYILSREGDVDVTLPSLFRGVVHVRGHDGLRQTGRTRYSRMFRKRIRSGHIKLDTCTAVEDDEVYIHTEGKIQLRLMSGDDRWNRVGVHVHRIFGNV